MQAKKPPSQTLCHNLFPTKIISTFGKNSLPKLSHKNRIPCDMLANRWSSHNITSPMLTNYSPKTSQNWSLLFQPKSSTFSPSCTARAAPNSYLVYITSAFKTIAEWNRHCAAMYREKCPTLKTSWPVSSRKKAPATPWKRSRVPKPLLKVLLKTSTTQRQPNGMRWVRKSPKSSRKTRLSMSAVPSRCQKTPRFSEVSPPMSTPAIAATPPPPFPIRKPRTMPKRLQSAHKSASSRKSPKNAPTKSSRSMRKSTSTAMTTGSVLSTWRVFTAGWTKFTRTS